MTCSALRTGLKQAFFPRTGHQSVAGWCINDDMTNLNCRKFNATPDSSQSVGALSLFLYKTWPHLGMMLDNDTRSVFLTSSLLRDIVLQNTCDCFCFGQWFILSVRTGNKWPVDHHRTADRRLRTLAVNDNDWFSGAYLNMLYCRYEQHDTWQLPKGLKANSAVVLAFETNCSQVLQYSNVNRSRPDGKTTFRFGRATAKIAGTTVVDPLAPAHKFFEKSQKFFEQAFPMWTLEALRANSPWGDRWER